MADELVFMMGKVEARFPSDLYYSKNHLWLRPLADRPNEYRVGLTAYSVKLLRDVYFLDWSTGPGFPVEERQEIGQIESSKAVSGMFAPAAGEISLVNDAVLSDPSLINTDGYGEGWLFHFVTKDALLNAGDYLAHLEAHWDETQRLIKKQITSS